MANKWRIDYLIAHYALLVAIPGIFAFFMRKGIPDDAFIYLRMAETVTAGGGWGFNTGETISAATSPAFLIVLILFRLLGLAGEAGLFVAFTAGLVIAALVTYSAFNSIDRRLGLIIALVLTTSPFVLRSIGLETSFLIGSIVLTAKAYQDRNLAWTGIFSGLTALARPEGAAMVFLVGAIEIYRTKRVPWRLGIFFSLVIVPWLAFAFAEFGTIVPHTVQVKSIQSASSWDLNGTLWIVELLRRVPAYPVVLALVPFGIVKVWREFNAGRPFGLVVCGFGLIQLAGYSLMNAPPGYWWYFVPANAALVSLAVFGFPTARHWLEGFVLCNLNISKMWLQPKIRVLSILVTVTLVLAFFHPYLRHLGRPYRLSEEYRQVGAWLAENGRPTDAVALTEIGYIGHFSGLRVTDMLGLLHAEALVPLSKGRVDWWFTMREKPKFIVAHNPPWKAEPIMDENSPYRWPSVSIRQFVLEYEVRFETQRIKVYERIDKAS